MKFFVSILATALLAVGLPGVADAQTRIHFLYTPAAAHAALYVAKEAGFFEKNGLDVRLTLTANGSLIPQALVSDSAQMGAPTTPVVLVASESGLDLVAVSAPEAYPSTSGTGLLVRADSSIKTAADLSGKTIATPGLGGVLDVLGRQWIVKNGGDLDKIRFVEAPMLALNDALTSGQVDAIVTVDPFMGRALGSKSAVRLGNIDSIIPAGTYVVIYASTRDWANKNKAAVAGFQKAMAEAAAYIKDPSHDDAVRQAVAKYTKLPEPVVKHLPLPKNFVSVPEVGGLTFMIDLSVDRGLIKSKPDPKKLLAN